MVAVVKAVVVVVVSSGGERSEGEAGRWTYGGGRLLDIRVQEPAGRPHACELAQQHHVIVVATPQPPFSHSDRNSLCGPIRSAQPPPLSAKFASVASRDGAPDSGPSPCHPALPPAVAP